MRVRVTMRLNVATGEITPMVVDDLGTRRGEDHDARHDEIAAEVGRVLDPRPRVVEVLPGSGPAEETPLLLRPEEEQAELPERRTQTEGG